MNEVLQAACQRVFQYPSVPLRRRHGPRGYADYRAYKPWLRDQFTFRCAYCLWRERWEAEGRRAFSVEHIQPQSAAPESRLDYDNLLYACNICNATRQDAALPIDPLDDPPGRHLRVRSDGTVDATTERGSDLVELCRLNRPLLVAARRPVLALIAVLQASNDPKAADALRDLLSFPVDLPDLAAMRPPGGNLRQDRIADCFFELRRRGELPEAY